MDSMRGSIFEFAKLGYYRSELDARERRVRELKQQYDAVKADLEGIPLDRMGLYFKIPEDNIEDMNYFERGEAYGIFSPNEVRERMGFDITDTRISNGDVRCEYCGGYTKTKSNCVNCGAPLRRIR